MSAKPFILGLLPSELEQALVAAGHQPYRARQVLRWLYQRGTQDFAHMSDLPQPLRDQLAHMMRVNPLPEAIQRRARDGSVKLAFRLTAGGAVEAVVMPQDDRVTVCVSSQVGCAYNCAFCATGGLGLGRNLTSAEIVGQVSRARQAAAGRVSNVVFMGMGEPLANYAAVVKAARIMNHPAAMNIGARRIAISTCGLPAQMRRLAGEGLALHLAVSLNAPDDELRSRLMPINRRYPMAAVIAAAREYAQRSGRKISFEYCLLAGVNDSPAQAVATARLIRGIPAMVNLINYNQARGGFERPRVAAMRAFQRALQESGVEVAIRRSFGVQVAAACGQLAAKEGATGG
jgi:23S rRNA (adenine2503-C2)-methyltransferase